MVSFLLLAENSTHNFTSEAAANLWFFLSGQYLCTILVLMDSYYCYTSTSITTAATGLLATGLLLQHLHILC